MNTTQNNIIKTDVIEWHDIKKELPDYKKSDGDNFPNNSIPVLIKYSYGVPLKQFVIIGTFYRKTFYTSFRRGLTGDAINPLEIVQWAYIPNDWAIK